MRDETDIVEKRNEQDNQPPENLGGSSSPLRPSPIDDGEAVASELLAAHVT